MLPAAQGGEGKVGLPLSLVPPRHHESFGIRFELDPRKYRETGAVVRPVVDAARQKASQTSGAGSHERYITT
jgi:hypothetical protein